MSADTAAPISSGGLMTDARNRRVLRYALGTTIALALATGFPWALAYIAPYVVVFLLASAKTAPSLKSGVAYMAIVTFACYAGLWSCQFFLDAPIVLLGIIGLALLWIFYAQASGAPSFLVTWLLISILVIPLLAVQSPVVATLAVEGIIIGAAATLFSLWSAFALVPEPAPPVATAGPAAPRTERPSPRTRLESATTITLVVMPMVVFFHLCAWVDGVLVLGYTGFLAMTPAFAKDLKAGKVLIFANAMGGVVAIIMFEILTIVPEFPYLVLLTLLTGLYFGSLVMSANPKASVYGRAFATVVLIITSVTTSSSGAATSEVIQRVFQIMAAVIYVVVAYALMRRFNKARKV